MRIPVLICFISLFAGKLAFTQPLAATDGLGRTLLQNNAVGNPKPNRHVALFYFLWQGDKGSPTSPHSWDLSELYANHPEVFEDAENPGWGGAKGTYYYWGQPVYGYYRGDDYWVHLRNIQLLTDAGVDILIIDATNRLTYPLQSEVLMKAMDAVRAQKKNPPKIVFYTNTASGETIDEIYEQFYKAEAPYRHPDCWYYLDGKPLVIGVTKETKGKPYEHFFTFRESQWPTVPKVINGWPWISFTRKPEVHYNARGEKEIINVSVAQHPNPTAGMGGSAFYGNTDNWGRSYRNNSPGNPASDIRYGYNFQEQWDYALAEDVLFVFVTGWNEWIAGRWKSHDSNPKHSWFCDQASPEFSRDIEPSLTAGLNDHYYMQLVNNIRRYKGIAKNPNDNALITIRKLEDWDKVDNVYTDYTGDTEHRNHPGAASKPEIVYTNNTGRNDFHILKVAKDRKHLFFYVQTTGAITNPSDNNWMCLYIDWDKNAKTGWNGYDYRVAGGIALEQYSDGKWTAIDKKAVKLVINGNKMMLTIPVAKLAKLPGLLQFEFKWSDNMQEEYPLDWYINGDAAPGGRFNYQYAAQ